MTNLPNPRWLSHVVAARGRFAILACALLLGCESPTAPPWGEEYDLLFVSNTVGAPGSDIYRTNADASGRVNLTNLSAVQMPTFVLAVSYRGLTLAPDGRTLAFDTTREGCPGIWGMGTDGSALRKLSIGTYQETRCNHDPFWAPNGSLITFMTSREGAWSTYVANADGTNPHNVAKSLDATGAQQPTGWTPDGRVVIDHYTTSARIAYVVNADGSNLQLLFGRGTDHEPHWSPDGSKVAFLRDAEGGASVWVANADGSGARRLTNHPGVDYFYTSGFPNGVTRWSPDGRLIAYSAWLNGQYELHVVDVEGTRDVTLTTYTANFSGWAPDGRVTFDANVDGTSDIFLINADGTDRVNLTATSGFNETHGLWVRR